MSEATNDTIEKIDNLPQLITEDRISSEKLDHIPQLQTELPTSNTAEKEIQNNCSNSDGTNNDILDVVFALENEKQSILEESRKRIESLRFDLENTKLENEKLKRKVVQLEQTLKQSVTLGGGEASKDKQDHEELLLRAKTLLFEKTKVTKQQEQQIATMKSQIEALKSVIQVTKDMVELKTTENEHMEARLSSAQQWIKAEKDKCAIVEKKLLISKGISERLKAEYDVQSKILKELKETYEAKVRILSETVEKLKK